MPGHENAMSVQVNLETILNKRRQYANTMQSYAQELQNLAAQMENILQLEAHLKEEEKKRKEITSEQFKQAVFGTTDAVKRFEDCIKRTRICKESLSTAAQEYENLAVQFRRNTVSLAVVGKMGSGKSLLLQQISHIGGDYIPSGDGPSCTGATCIIENVDEGRGTRVLISFKSVEQVLADVQAEVNRLWKMFTRSDAKGPALGSLDRDEIERVYGMLEDKYRNSYKEHSNQWRQSDSIYRNQWETWHKLLPPLPEDRQDWLNLLKTEYFLTPAPEEGPEWYLLDNNASKVREFVAKFSGNQATGGLDFHCAHIVVDTVLIQNHFPGVEAQSLRLIDTIGINDPSSETSRRLEDALNRKTSDGVIYLDKYVDGRTPDVHEYDSLTNILKERRATHKGAGYTMALLINVASAQPNHRLWVDNYLFDDVNAADKLINLPNAQQLLNDAAAPLPDFCKTIRTMDKTAGSTLFGENGIQTYDVISLSQQPERLTDFLNRLMEQISKNPGDQDAILIANEARTEALNLTDSLLSDLNKLRRDVFPQDVMESRANIVSRYMPERRNALEKALKVYYDSVHEENLKTPLETHIENIEKLIAGESVGGISLSNIISAASDSFYVFGLKRRLYAEDMLYDGVREIGNMPPALYRETRNAHKTAVAKLFLDTLGIDLKKLSDINVPNLSEADKQFYAEMALLEPDDEHFFKKMSQLLFRNKSGGSIEQLEKHFQSFEDFDLNNSSSVAQAIMHHAAACYLSPRERGQYDFGIPAYAMRKVPANVGESAPLSPSSPRNRPNQPKFTEKVGEQFQQSGAQSANDDLKSDMMSSLREMLNAIQSKYCDEINRDLYAVPATFQIKQEIMNFIMCVDLKYQAEWLRVFESLYEYGVLLGNEKEWEAECAVLRGDIIRSLDKICMEDT